MIGFSSHLSVVSLGIGALRHRGRRRRRLVSIAVLEELLEAEASADHAHEGAVAGKGGRVSLR